MHLILYIYFKEFYSTLTENGHTDTDFSFT